MGIGFEYVSMFKSVVIFFDASEKTLCRVYLIIGTIFVPAPKDLSGSVAVRIVSILN